VTLPPDWLAIDEQQEQARQRARVELPTVQRDFAELWGEVT